jgi:hypothetical protein
MAKPATAQQPAPAPAAQPAPAAKSVASLPKNKAGRSRIETERVYLDADGKEATESNGVALRITWPAAGATATWTVKPPTLPAPWNMLALRSAYTFVHNAMNSVINNEKKPGTIEQAIQAANELTSEWAAGKWESRRDIGAGGPREAKIDLAIMAEVVAEYARAHGKPGAQASDYLSKLQADKSYAAKVRSNTDFRSAYDKKAGKQATTADLI